ncbi:MAG: 3-hydroxyacyl-ACP dehydratase FabZ [Alphaproteobacteria bacterium]|nr:3-hydroxyacyl-ACP dehydratase FabZ [Alphaproteobacteria bacterium]
MIDIKGIEQIIPHRGDMRLVDEIREFTDKTALGIKYVRDNEFWCAGHFPAKPIMPGVLIIEALAQTACFTVLKSIGNNGGKALGYFVTIENAKFTHMVVPGDTLELHIEEIGAKMKLHKFTGNAFVNGRRVATATFSAMLDDNPQI